MSVWRKLNPFEWTAATILRVFGGFFVVALPLWFSGFSVFATTVGVPNAGVEIARIGLSSEVAPVELKNHRLETPEKVAGSYTNGNKVFLYGHSTGVFAGLAQVAMGDIIAYGEGESRAVYRVEEVEILPVGEVNMAKLIADTPQKQLVLMTCAGERLADDDYTERLIIYATYADE